MGRQTKFSKNARSRYFPPRNTKRIVRSRQERYRYLIVCEGVKSEPYYFEALKKRLPKKLVDIDIIGAGAETLRIVQIAKEKFDEKRRTPHPYDKVWVVFDRDSFPASDFDNAIHSAAANGFGCAWSNEAFELWYLLHFEFRNTAMTRTKYEKSLSALLGTKYVKNDPGMFAKLEDKQGTAIKNAGRLLERHAGQAPSKSNPATQVHLLVKELNQYRNPK